MTPSRAELAKQLESAGIVVNDVRNKCLEKNYVYVGGALRAAEECIKVAFDMLDDPNTKESEL